jgi:broad specificity phosphatase PhoE
MELLLIRHGDTFPETDHYNEKIDRADPPLTPKGKLQAALLGKRLVHAGISSIYASDLERARDTAAIMQKGLGCPLFIRKALREIDMGNVQKIGWEDFRIHDPEFWIRWEKHEADLPYPGGERGADAQQRCMPLIAEIAKGGDSRSAIVTHGGIIRVILCACLGIGQEHRFFFGHPLQHCSLSIIKYDTAKGKCHLQLFNDITHLETLMTDENL